MRNILLVESNPVFAAAAVRSLGSIGYGNGNSHAITFVKDYASAMAEYAKAKIVENQICLIQFQLK